MTFASRLTRSPIAFEPDPAREARALFDGMAGEVVELLSATAGCSPYLWGLMARESDWLRAVLEADPEDVLKDLLVAPAGDEAGLRRDLRIAKRRVALYAGLADLGGVWSLEQVTGGLTRLADFATGRALSFQIGREIRRGKLAGMGEGDLEDCAGAVALAMGKGGAFELNYSSDIDLILLFDERRFAPDDFAGARSAMIRAVRRMTPMLSELTADGYVFRTDLRLRPDPAVTPVIVGMAAAERYYESLGRTWERAAYIKARACAGDVAGGAAFLDRLAPFVWRKHLDFAAIQDAHDMRLRIRAHKGTGGRLKLEGHDMKLGRGGIREIEFFTQTRQLIAGGRDASLRQRATLDGLAALAARGWVPGDVAATLTRHYRAHREVEHRMQMIRDQQTHALPGDAEGFRRLACLMGEGDVGALRGRLRDALEEVHALTEDFFAPASQGGGAGPEPSAMSEESLRIVERWQGYPALRSKRAMAIFERLRPGLLARLEAADRPREALVAFDGFIAGLPAGVQVFSLFEANPSLVDLIIDIAATAPDLARYLGQNSQVLDAVIGGDFFADWPGRDALEAALAQVMARVPDYESRLDAARSWAREWHFRIGVHHLRAIICAKEAGRQYGDLAGAVLAALWPVCVQSFAERHGAAPGRGAAVIGMGSLGAGLLNARSDLDLLVIYDAAGAEQSEGRRPLASRTYYARLTQAFVTALSAPMAQGRLYEVDMRLRPSGRQGPVATSLESFRDYQLNEAWTWEHLALTRARPVAGEAALMAEVEAVRVQVLNGARDRAGVLGDVADMRARIEAAKGAGIGPFEAKIGPGHLQDIELCAQTSALLAGSDLRETVPQLSAGDLLAPNEAARLAEAYAFLWRLQAASRLLTADPVTREYPGQGGLGFLLRETGLARADALEETIARHAGAAFSIIDRVIGAPGRKEAI